MVLLAAACTALAPTVRHASPRHEQDPLPGGLTTPFRAAQHCDQQAGRPCDQQAGRPHCAVGLTTPFRATQHRDQQAGRPCATSRLVAHTAPLAWWRQRARPSRPPERNWEAMATGWKRRWNRPHPPTLPKGTCRETPPNPPNRAESAPARRPTASARPLTAQLPSPPTWELPPSLPHPPVSGVAKTYLPEPTAEDALGSEPAPA